jgi:hypothetical protein
MKTGSTLTHENTATGNYLATVSLGAKTLRITVATVP